jgi:orotidine-5'-phosphate decarboxylase
MLTVHAAGGAEMMRRAVAEAGGVAVLAVTVLTSLDIADLLAVGDLPVSGGSVESLVLKRAMLAHQAGCAGVIASPREVGKIREVVPPDFLVVTPGVRPAGGPAGDQKRVATAAEAICAGASHLVVGRPIRDAADPRAAARAICAEIAAARATP